MKTTLKILTAVLTGVLITVACGNSKSKLPKEDALEASPVEKLELTEKKVSDSGFDFENYMV